MGNDNGPRGSNETISAMRGMARSPIPPLIAGTNFSILPSALKLASPSLGATPSTAIPGPIPSPAESLVSKLVVVASGIPAQKRELVDSILAGQYICFTELPPAKGCTKALNTLIEGQIVLMQAADYWQEKRLIPDLAIRIQCFSLYMAVILTKYPDRATSLLLYQS